MDQPVNIQAVSRNFLTFQLRMRIKIPRVHTRKTALRLSDYDSISQKAVDSDSRYYGLCQIFIVRQQSIDNHNITNQDSIIIPSVKFLMIKTEMANIKMVKVGKRLNTIYQPNSQKPV